MSQNRLLWMGVGLVALIWLLLSLLGLALVLILALVEPGTAATGALVTLGGMSLVSLLLAGSLLLATQRAWRGQPSAPWRPRRLGLPLGLGFLLTLALGILIPSEQQTSLLFMPVHAGMIVLSAALLMMGAALAAGSTSPTRRQWALTLSWGALATVPAIVLELLAALVTLIGLAVFMTLLPDGQATLEAWRQQLEALQASGQPLSYEQVQAWLRSPYILGTLALLLGLVTPVTEELLKTLPLILLTRRERGASLPRAYLWGLACGAGFAMIEGIGNGGTGLGASMGGWLSGIISRVPASAMHMLTSGLIGLGWAYAWRRQYGRLLLAYGLALGFHSLWNFLAVSLMGSIALADITPVPGTAMLSGLLLSMLALTALVLVPLLPLGLRLLDERTSVMRSPDEPGNTVGTMAL